MGTVTFENLPPLAQADSGDMYNISNQFTTTSDFVEGAGIVVPLGSNVYKTVGGKWDVLAGSPVTGVKGNSESTYRRGNVNITKSNIGLGNVDNTSDANKPVSTAQQAALNSKQNITDNSLTTTSKNIPGAINEINASLSDSNDRIESLEAIALSETRVAIACNTAVSGITPFGYKGTSLPISSSANDKIYAVTLEKPSSGDWIFSVDVNQTNRTITVYANENATVYAEVVYRHNAS